MSIAEFALPFHKFPLSIPSTAYSYSGPEATRPRKQSGDIAASRAERVQICLSSADVVGRRYRIHIYLSLGSNTHPSPCLMRESAAKNFLRRKILYATCISAYDVDTASEAGSRAGSRLRSTNISPPSTSDARKVVKFPNRIL